MTLAKDMIRKSRAMVIIGYSFPYFNRVVDKDLFNTNMLRGLDIYIQDPDAINIAESVKALIPESNKSSVRIKSIVSNLKQFYMPYEMD